MTDNRVAAVTVREESLDRDAVEAVLDLARRSEDADGVAPLSEQALLRVRHHGARTTHLVARAPAAEPTGDDRPTQPGPVVGYLLLEAGPDDRADEVAAELVVHPAHRRRGIGRALLAAALASAAAANPRATMRIWAHGNRPEAAALAAQLGFVADRVLLQMRRATADPLPDAPTAAGVLIRTFEPGRDDEAWVAVNARAFAGHPEQAYLTVDDLRQRQAEPWFDPAGFFLAERVEDGRLLGFHWTKVHERPERVGEVYVVGVDPEAQGLGLGRTLTVTGLAHLAALGLPAVILYADESNTAAVAMYERLGFTTVHTDIEYARPVA